MRNYRLYGFLGICMLLASTPLQAQQPDTTSSLPMPNGSNTFVDSILRITNLNPFFTLHADSVMEYALQINKPLENYFWFLRSAPVGVRIHKSTGLLYCKAEKSLFKSGRLKYDVPYRVELGVQNLSNPNERFDTTTTIVFYDTEVIPSRLKPSAPPVVFITEGDSLKFKMQCEMGTFPLLQITMQSNFPIANYKGIRQCDEEFSWTVPFDFIKDEDTAQQKSLSLTFIGNDKFFNKDSTTLKVIVLPGIDFKLRSAQHQKVATEVQSYVTRLKLTFYALSTAVRKNKNVRTAFDISSSTTALAGTVLSTTATTDGSKNAGKILPSVGLTLVPIKEAISPVKSQEQNTATQVRTITKRLEYMLSQLSLVGDRDPKVIVKTSQLLDELNQAKLQLVDLPLLEVDNRISQEEADRFFYDPNVNKRYKLKLN